MLRYSVTLNPRAHLLHLSLEIVPAKNFINLQMAAWTSGSYLIRDYAGRIRGPRTSKGTLAQKDKCHWVVTDLDPGVPICIEWEVFAYSTGIHDAWLDDLRGFINPAAILLVPVGDDSPCMIEFPDGAFIPHCSLKSTDGLQFTASNIQELLDAPVTFTTERGEHCIFELAVEGIRHKLVFSGPGVSHLNSRMILRDVEAILKTVIAFWGRAPFERYLFHVQVGPHLFGGLEHEASSVLQTDSLALPGAEEQSRPKGYDDFLTVLAHEYFHAWLVKHLRPAAFLPYKLDRECHTHDLWLFEGFTTYYENLLPFRAGVIDKEKLLALTSARFNRVREREGFFAESLAGASFNAWIHLYKQTADSPYSQTSYYGKGAVLAFMLDAALRKTGRSLDVILRSWFHEALENPLARSLPDGAFFERIPDQAIAGRFKRLTESTERPLWEAEWKAALDTFGMTEENDGSDSFAQTHLGLHLDGIRIRYAESRGPAFAAGLFAGDEIVADNNLRVDPAGIERLLSQLAGSTARVHYFREHLLRTTEVAVPSEPLSRPGMLKIANPTKIGRAWLSLPNPQA